MNKRINQRGYRERRREALIKKPRPDLETYE
jgi:hypothetical protein